MAYQGATMPWLRITHLNALLKQIPGGVGKGFAVTRFTSDTIYYIQVSASYSAQLFNPLRSRIESKHDLLGT